MIDTYKTTHRDPAEIDKMRLKAFATNDPDDRDRYFKAASLYFQERIEREMNREEASRAAMTDAYNAGWNAGIREAAAKVESLWAYRTCREVAYAILALLDSPPAPADGLPDRIMVWRSNPNLDHTGTWATTRYPDNAVEYERALSARLAEVEAANRGLVRLNEATEARAEAAEALLSEVESHSDYDAGLLNDWGGGNVEWWQDYLRAEIAKANDHWRACVAQAKEGRG